MAADFDPRFDPAFQRGYVDVTVAPPAQQPAERPVPPPRNPWLVVLWVLAGTLLAAGVGGYLWAVTQKNPDYEVTSVVYPAVVAALAPWLVTVALLALVLAVFVHALRWRQS